MVEQIKAWFISLWEQIQAGNLWDETIIAVLAACILLNVPFARWIALVALVYAIWGVISGLK